MGDFFKGWRRKAGLVTLAMALLLTVAWMRSYGVRDEISIPGHQYGQSIESFGGGVCWQRWSNSSGPLDDLSIELKSYKDVPTASYPWEDLEVEWRRDWAGFRFGAATFTWKLSNQTFSDRMELWTVPYWSLVLPLTLLSAWLILAKPRKA